MDEEQCLHQSNEDEVVSIIHPVHDTNSIKPFVHALKLALATKGELEIIDVRKEQEIKEHIGVRTFLERWGILIPGSDRGDVAEIGLRVKKIVREGNKRKEIIKRLQRHHHDILVIGTETQRGVGSIFNRSLAEYLADYFHQTTLFVPSGARSIVNEKTGAVNLQKIVLPISTEQLRDASFIALKRFMAFFPDIKPTLIGVHNGDVFPEIPEDYIDGFEWKTELRKEGVVSSILAVAKQSNADLIVMATNGRDSLPQKITGSFTEQVLRCAPCPVLSTTVE